MGSIGGPTNPNSETMRWTKYRLMLALLMVITGTLNTIIAKWTTTEEARNTVGLKESFDHPFLQSTGYFFGEFMCLLVYFLYRLILKLHSFFTDSDDEAVKIVERRREVREVSLKDDLLKNEPKEFTWRNYYLFLFPAICDVSATSAMYVGLYLTSASSYQMLRGSVIIFTGLASRFFLRKKLHWYKWLGMFVILGGLFVVGCADLFSKKCMRETTDNELSSFETTTTPSENATTPSEDYIDTSEICNEDEERLHSIIGDIILIGAQIVVAFQGTYEEKLLKKYSVAPILAMGLEGFFGFTIL